MGGPLGIDPEVEVADVAAGGVGRVDLDGRGEVRLRNIRTSRCRRAGGRRSPSSRPVFSFL